MFANKITLFPKRLGFLFQALILESLTIYSLKKDISFYIYPRKIYSRSMTGDVTSINGLLTMGYGVTNVKAPVKF